MHKVDKHDVKTSRQNGQKDRNDVKTRRDKRIEMTKVQETDIDIY